MAAPFTLADLERIVAERAGASPTGILDREAPRQGPGARGEEARRGSGRDRSSPRSPTTRTALIAESADLLYHLLVVLRSRGVALQDVLDELQRRSARSGLAEKAARRDG